MVKTEKVGPKFAVGQMVSHNLTNGTVEVLKVVPGVCHFSYQVKARNGKQFHASEMELFLPILEKPQLVKHDNQDDEQYDSWN